MTKKRKVSDAKGYIKEMSLTDTSEGTMLLLLVNATVCNLKPTTTTLLLERRLALEGYLKQITKT